MEKVHFSVWLGLHFLPNAEDLVLSTGVFIFICGYCTPFQCLARVTLLYQMLKIWCFLLEYSYSSVDIVLHFSV